jgi:DNA-binding LacI/PurR family transcriptional regulator
MTDNHLQPEPELFMEEEETSGVPGDIREEGYRHTARLLARRPDIDTIFCTNDFLAAGAARFCQENGLDQVAISGYDNFVSELSRDNRFSTVDIDFVRIGKKAVDIAADSIRHCPKIFKIAPKILIRKRELEKAPTCFK